MISFVCIDILCDPFADLYKSAVSWMVPAELYWYKWYVFRSEPIGSKMEDFFICRQNDFFVENKTESTVSISDEITQIIYFNVCQNYLGFYDYDIDHIKSTGFYIWSLSKSVPDVLSLQYHWYESANGMHR